MFQKIVCERRDTSKMSVVSEIDGLFQSLYRNVYNIK